MTLTAILLSVLCLAYANGANDNFKGVATLLGSGTTDYRWALAWATGTTFLGSLTAVFLAGTLLKSFSGKGLVASDLVTSVDYGAAVALGAGLTVLLATRIGMPISTTHSLVGALIGAGWAAGSAINVEKLGNGFFVPLLVSPFLALGVTVLLYPIFSHTRRRWGITSETCLCVGNETVEVVPTSCSAVAIQRAEQLSIQIGDVVTCQSRYRGKMLGIEAATALDRLHYLSAGSLTFSLDESKLYFGSFWVDGFFEMETATGKVTRLFRLPTPKDDSQPQEVTYHGCEAVSKSIVLGANEGRSYVDSVNVTTGEHVDRLTDVSKPCCIERIPGTNPVRVLISNIASGTLGVVEVSTAGKLKLVGTIKVGKSPKRVAYLP